MEHKIALAGNPNSGKTTIFNLLCGARERIGNWPGTTVEKKEGICKIGDTTIKVVDLPGIYALTAYSVDERIAMEFLVKERPELVVCVVDATNMERNLYLTIQLLEMGQRLILDLNMMDIVEKTGIEIDADKLSQLLKVDVVKTVGIKGKGIEELKAKIIDNLNQTDHQDLLIEYPEIEDFIKQIVTSLTEKDIKVSLPYRAVAIRILEGDLDLLAEIKGTCPEIEGIRKRAEREVLSRYGEDLETYIIETRYAFLQKILKDCVKKTFSSKREISLSDKIDKVLTHRLFGIPIFLFFMFLLFQLVFALGSPIADGIDDLFSSLVNLIQNLSQHYHIPPFLVSLICDGIISGIGSVLVFLPNIALLFLGIAILEDSGYLSRAAFVMDRFMSTLGLHGKSFIPLLLGFGCNITGIMATRTLEARKDRILTILVNPLMSCSARLPVYTLFASAFFPRHQGIVVFSLYLLGIVLAILAVKVFNHLFFKGQSTPLVMELPPYRIPNLRTVALSVWTRSALFVKKAGTVIFLSVLGIWLLSSLPPGVEYAGENSLIGRFGKALAPIFAPAGFGFWQAGVALTFGVIAKEVVVGTLATLYGASEEGLRQVLLRQFTPLSAYAFLVMTLVYIPCIATIAVIKKETNWKWALFTVSYSLVLGWLLSVAVYQVGGLFVK